MMNYLQRKKKGMMTKAEEPKVAATVTILQTTALGECAMTIGGAKFNQPGDATTKTYATWVGDIINLYYSDDYATNTIRVTNGVGITPSSAEEAGTGTQSINLTVTSTTPSFTLYTHD